VAKKTARKRRIQDRNNSIWIAPGDIDVEIEQCQDEGKRLGRLKAQGLALKKRLGTADAFGPAAAESRRRKKRASSLEVQLEARRWLGKTLNLKEHGAYAGQEPSDLAGIRKLRPKAPRVLGGELSPRRAFDRIYGAWLGRCCGCYLGKPVEGASRADIHAILKYQKRFPLNDYFTRPAPPEIRKRGGKWAAFPTTYKKRCMIEDDDTNYTTIGLAVMKQYGLDFAPVDMAEFWLNNVPLLHTCTAERAAYRNFSWGINPPESAVMANPYREWIGAQIRADAFGYVAVARPEKAAELAWRDACISHVKNGIYGEMWVAACLAWAYEFDDPREVVMAGLGEIPLRSRLADAVRHIVQLYDNGLPADAALRDIHQRWNEKRRHHWVHTLSNAEIVVYALLWGERNFGRTICLAVDAAFDTDCNGATAGSILGMMLGAKKLPARWTRQLGDTLETGVAGYYRVKISDMARGTVELARRLAKRK